MKSYSELIKLPTFEERYNYLKLSGKVCDSTFGSARYLNQALYTSPEWKRLRRDIIIRDKSCDLGIDDRPIPKYVLIHHINPITLKDIQNRSPVIFDPDNLICVSKKTHNAIHYGDESLLFMKLTERFPDDTCPWRW